MESMLRTLYELNEKYHDTKEHVVWLAATIYLAFSLLVIQTKSVLPSEWAGLILLFLVFLLTFLFIVGQTWMKCISAIRTGKFLKLVAGLDGGRATHKTLVDETDPNRFAEGDVKFFREGWSGFLILVVISVFWVAQIVILPVPPIWARPWLSNLLVGLLSFMVAIGLSRWLLYRLRIGRKDDADFLRFFRKAGYEFVLRLRLESTKSSFPGELGPTIDDILDRAVKEIESAVQQQTSTK